MHCQPRTDVSAGMVWPAALAFDSICYGGYHLSCPSRVVSVAGDLVEAVLAMSVLSYWPKPMTTWLSDRTHVPMQQNQKLCDVRDPLLPQLMSGEIA